MKLNPAFISPPPDEEVNRRILREPVLRYIENLPPKEARVIQLRYGLDGGEPLTFQQIGDRLGFGRNNAARIHNNALERLRHPSVKRGLRWDGGEVDEAVRRERMSDPEYVRFLGITRPRSMWS